MNSNTLEDVLKRLQITSLNAMQLAALEEAKKENDLVLLSPTGSGKTLAFLLPLLASLKSEVSGVQALILSPSRELALQIEQVFKSMGTGFKVNACYGGHPFKTEKNNLTQAPAVLVGTPGRLADHLRRNSFDPTTISFLVMDEFDKALEFGFEKDMSFIIAQCSGLKKRMLTSATKPLEIPAFAGIQSPIELNYLTTTKALEGLELKSVRAEGHDKLYTLFKLICKIGDGVSLVFCNHRDAVDRISELLHEQGVVHDVFHGGLEQENRERALIKFRNGSHRLLITTDLASRGLDIPEIEHVIHYQLPLTEDSFIHRNGRTARMHAEGTAYLVMAKDEELPKYIHQKISEEPLSDKTPLPELPLWETLYIGGGKKDKINKVDIVGLLLQKGGLAKDDLGLIEVQDKSSFVAIKRDKIHQTLNAIRNEKIKKMKMRMAISR
ncbi:MAG: DEAD/DEAH box helicase [Cytophagaceae bacterium]|nr:DEAD/DEAH box helicase [Cytophagaceae bacterium]